MAMIGRRLCLQGSIIGGAAAACEGLGDRVLVGRWREGYMVTVETLAGDDVDGSRRRFVFPEIGDRGGLGVVRFAPATDDGRPYKGESVSRRGISGGGLSTWHRAVCRASAGQGLCRMR